MRYIFALLFLASSAFAQNVTYPYTSASSSGGGGDVYLASTQTFTGRITIDPAATNANPVLMIAADSIGFPITISNTANASGSSGGIQIDTAGNNGIALEVLKGGVLQYQLLAGPNGEDHFTNPIVRTGNITPGASNAQDIGTAALPFNDGFFNGSLKVGGSNVMTSAGGGGVNTNVFPQGIYIGASNLILKQTSDGANDINLELTHTANVADVEFEIRLPVLSDTSSFAEVASYLDFSGDANNHLALGDRMARGMSGAASNGVWPSTTYQIGSGTIQNIDFGIDDGANDGPVGIFRMMTNRHMAVQNAILISSNTDINISTLYSMLITPTRFLADPELSLAHNANGFAKIGARSMATTGGGMTDEQGIIFCGPSYTDGGGVFTNAMLFSMLTGQRFIIRAGPNAGNYPFRFVMDNDGNVGLSWTNMTERLDVNGNINARGVYKVNTVSGLTTTQTFLDASSAIKTNVFIGGILVSGP